MMMIEQHLRGVIVFTGGVKCMRPLDDFVKC